MNILYLFRALFFVGVIRCGFFGIFKSSAKEKKPAEQPKEHVDEKVTEPNEMKENPLDMNQEITADDVPK